MKTVKKFTGSQGSWEVRVDYTDGTKEILPCAHKYHLDGLCYNDPWSDELRALPRYQRHIDLIREKRKVVLTTDDTPVEGPRFKRTGYIAVFSIADFVEDADGMRFRLTERFPNAK
jgi:hypothetical protein